MTGAMHTLFLIFGTPTDHIGKGFFHLLTGKAGSKSFLIL